jgi:hypothetical protein
MPPQTWNVGPRPQVIHATEKKLRPIVGGLVFSRFGAGTAGKWLLLVALCYCLRWCSAADAPVTLLPPNLVVEGQLASNVSWLKRGWEARDGRESFGNEASGIVPLGDDDSVPLAFWSRDYILDILPQAWPQTISAC